MGRMREATITMGVLLLTTTLMLMLLHTLRIVVEEALDWKIIIYTSFAICTWGIIAEIMLICAAQKRKVKMLLAWVVMAVMRAFAHCAVAVLMLLYDQNYPTVIICCYMFAFAMALGLASWRATLFVDVLRSGKGEIDDYRHRERKTPISGRIVRLLPFAAPRATVAQQEGSSRRNPGGPIQANKQFPHGKSVDRSTTTTAESPGSSTEPGDSASSTHSSYTDEPVLEITSSTETPSPPSIKNYPPRAVHSPPKPRPHPTVSRKIHSPLVSSPSPSSVTSPEYPVKPKQKVFERTKTPPMTSSVRRSPNIRQPPRRSPLRNKPKPRTTIYSKISTVSTLEIHASANELVAEAIQSEHELQPRSAKSPTQMKSETTVSNKDESLNTIDLELDVLHRLAKHASQDKVNSQFDEMKRSLIGPKVCKPFQDSLSSTKTNASLSDPEDAEEDLKLPDNSELKLKQKVSQGKVSEIIAGFEEKSYAATTKSKQSENKIFHDRVSKDDSSSREDKLSLGFSKDSRGAQLNTVFTKVLKQKSPLMMSQKKNTSSDTKLGKRKPSKKARPKSEERMQSISEQGSTSGKNYLSDNKPSKHRRDYVKEKRDVSENTAEVKSPNLESPIHFGDTSATQLFKHSGPARTPDNRKLKVSSAKVEQGKERRPSSEKRDANHKSHTFKEGTIVPIHGKMKRPEFERGSSPRIEDPKPRSRTRTKKPLILETRTPSKSKSPGRISRRNRGRNPESVTAHGATLRIKKKKLSPKYPPSPGIHMIDKRKRSGSRQMWPLSDAEEDSLTTFEATQVRAAIRVASRQRQLQLQEATAVAKTMTESMRRADGTGAPKVRKTK